MRPDMPAEENILVVPRTLLESLGIFEGLCFDVDRYMPALLDPRNNLFLPRSAAEEDPSYKQLIPYLLIRHGERVLHYVRGKSGGEARLHAKGSIGIGGHINDGDSHAEHFNESAYRRAVERELNEELAIAGSWLLKTAALLNDDATEVGRVHLGIVHVVEVNSPGIAPREDAIRDLAFLTAAELAPRSEQLENWSRICLGGLDRLLAR